MLEQCTVKKIKRDIAYVEIRRSDKCDGCKICAFNKRNSITVPALCDMPVEVGQTVTVEMPTKSVGSAALLIYALPLLGILIGAIIGLCGEWWLQLIIAAVGMALGLVLVVPIERMYRKKSGVLPVVIQTGENHTIENGEHNGT